MESKVPTLSQVHSRLTDLVENITVYAGKPVVKDSESSSFRAVVGDLEPYAMLTVKIIADTAKGDGHLHRYYVVSNGSNTRAAIAFDNDPTEPDQWLATINQGNVAYSLVSESFDGLTVSQAEFVKNMNVLGSLEADLGTNIMADVHPKRGWQCHVGIYNPTAELFCHWDDNTTYQYFERLQQNGIDVDKIVFDNFQQSKC